MLVSADESVLNLHRPKLEDVSLSTSMDSVMTCSNDVDIENNISSETQGCNIPVDYGNVKFDGSSIDMNLETHSNNLHDACKELANIAEQQGYSDDTKIPSGNPNVLTNLPQNCELMNMVKVTRSSWLRNCEFLHDRVIRFLCVLSLDRFGDYVSDQVVAPVRETSAQALGAAFKYMHAALVNETLNILLKMQLCGVRGGGNAAAQALFWQPKQGHSFVLAFESERERNAAIMLARRFAFDCNIMLAGPDDRAPLGT
ncbi:btaf1 RNA polymerase II, B-TFIID transcription factor-associated, 170kDa [Trifolium repens]|nr:btaf1 RNA polymerase II, B-TFIID transcription factor-associated, 170kDa [Trifolium repens]